MHFSKYSTKVPSMRPIPQDSSCRFSRVCFPISIGLAQFQFICGMTNLRFCVRWSPMTLTRFISVGNNAMWFHSASIERVLELFLTGYWERYHWPPPRLKDLERLTTVVSLSCHQSPRVGQYLRFLSTELAKRERLAEIEDHPCSLVSLVAHCAYLQHYPHDLLNIVLRPDIVQSVIGN